MTVFRASALPFSSTRRPPPSPHTSPTLPGFISTEQGEILVAEYSCLGVPTGPRMPECSFEPCPWSPLFSEEILLFSNVCIYIRPHNLVTAVCGIHLVLSSGEVRTFLLTSQIPESQAWCTLLGSLWSHFTHGEMKRPARSLVV